MKTIVVLAQQVMKVESQYHDVDLLLDSVDYPDEYYSEVMDTMYLPIDEAFNGQRPWDVTKFDLQIQAVGY